MAAEHSIIPPFPADINRGHFASWLSGFTDGEGTFQLDFRKRMDVANEFGSASFSICLRADDCGILDLIRSFWQCGRVHYYDNRRRRDPKWNPIYAYQVSKSSDLATIIVPHFDRFPLLAKKKRDFCIWKEAVSIWYRISQRKSRGNRHTPGLRPKWQDSERAEFSALNTALKAQRVFNASAVPLPEPIPPASRPTLFDGLQ